MNNIWFTSDLHFDHTNISGSNSSRWSSGYRTFDSVDEMNNTLIDTINKYVKEDDILYFLGDFCFGDHKKTSNYRSLIKCKTIHFIKGNHDKYIEKCRGIFSSICDTSTIKCDEITIFLSHYAHRVWNNSHRDTIHLYGHSHGTIDDHGKSMDVGVDVAYRMFGEYRPFSLEEIKDIMSSKKMTQIYL
jgi:calcineurin-like phosphoesterase family protein